MLRSLKEIVGYRLEAEDGWSGKVKDFLFDDLFWSIRYIVASTGRILPGRRVLISPLLVENPSWAQHRLPVDLTREQIESCPDLTEHEPVHLQMQRYAQAKGWPPIWSTSDSFALGQIAFPQVSLEDEEDEPEGPTGDPHLRSVKEILGYDIQAEDGPIGHVHDLIVEERTWILRYVVVDTRHRLPGGRKVLVSPGWIERLSWQARTVSVMVTRETVEAAPDYDPAQPVNRAYEVRLFDFYGRPVYWKDRGTRFRPPPPL